MSMTPLQTDITVITLAASADYASTKYALKNCSSCYEFNPFLRNDVAHVSFKLASVAAGTLAADELRKRNHKTWAKIVRYTFLAIYLGSTVNNMRIGYEHKNDGKNR